MRIKMRTIINDRPKLIKKLSKNMMRIIMMGHGEKGLLEFDTVIDEIMFIVREMLCFQMV
jgi:hypothetical protein